MRIASNRRQGTSMLEAMVYVSLSAVLATLTAQWFHVVFQVASKNKLLQRQHCSLKRLAEDLRTDVVAATDVNLTGKRAALTCGAGEEIVYEIIYEIQGGNVKKIVGDPKQPSRQEIYLDLDDLRIEFVKGASPSSVVMNVFRPAPALGREDSQSKPQSGSVQERALLQVKCRPIVAPLEMIE